jgi:hypothetical protein
VDNEYQRFLGKLAKEKPEGQHVNVRTHDKAISPILHEIGNDYAQVSKFVANSSCVEPYSIRQPFSPVIPHEARI